MVLFLILTIIAGNAGEAGAQATRAEELRARREAKARELQRPGRNRVERVL